MDRLVDGGQESVGGHAGHGSGQLGKGSPVVRDAVVGWVEQLDVGPAVALPPVEGGVSLVGQLPAIPGEGGQGRDTDGQREGGDAERPGASAQRVGQDPSSDADRLVRLAVREHDAELVAADPERTARPGEAGEDDPGRRAEEFVARGVALGLVDLLELVQVHHQERDRS